MCSCKQEIIIVFISFLLMDKPFIVCFCLDMLEKMDSDSLGRL